MVTNNPIKNNEFEIEFIAKDPYKDDEDVRFLNRCYCGFKFLKGGDLNVDGIMEYLDVRILLTKENYHSLSNVMSKDKISEILIAIYNDSKVIETISYVDPVFVSATLTMEHDDCGNCFIIYRFGRRK